MSKTVLVLAGGDPAVVGGEIPDAALVIAADSGLDQAHRLAIEVDLVVGDLDSVSETALRAAREAGTEVEQHPEAKDATDLELAMAAALRRAATRIVVIGGAGGRIDHLLANAMLLASPAWADVDVEWLVDGARVVAIRTRAVFHGKPGDILTLLAVGEPADGITTSGLQYQLQDSVLLASSTRGVSNVFTAETATVELRAGVLLAIHQPD